MQCNFNRKNNLLVEPELYAWLSNQTETNVDVKLTTNFVAKNTLKRKKEDPEQKIKKKIKTHQISYQETIEKLKNS